MPKQNSMFNIAKFCKEQKDCANVEYFKVATAGNDPSISKAMRYSQYVNTQKGKTVQISVPISEQPNNPASIFTQVITRFRGTGYKPLINL